MNNDMNLIVGRELTDQELMMIQGGSIISAIGSVFSTVGKALGADVKAVGHFFRGVWLAHKYTVRVLFP
jgi:hypothetical protein